MRISNRGTCLRLIVVLSVILVVAIADQVARADGGFDWSQWIPDDGSVEFSVRIWEDGGQPGTADDVNVIDVTSTRGPIVAGTCSLDAVVHSSRADLLSIRLLEGDDVNGNGTIDPAEWIVLGTASAAPDGSGGSVATIPAQTASAGRAAHRVEQTFTWGVTYDEISDCNLN